MKKAFVLVLVAMGLSSCSWFQSGADWADNTFFEPSTPPNNAGGGYPYYYSAAAIDANEPPSANALTGTMVTGYPQPAPGSQMGSNPYATPPQSYGQPPQYQVQQMQTPQYGQQPMQTPYPPQPQYQPQPYGQPQQFQQAPTQAGSYGSPQAAHGGYSAPANSATTSITLDKGGRVKSLPAKPVLPPLPSAQQAPNPSPVVPQQPQYQPQQSQQPVTCFNQMGQPVSCGASVQPEPYEYPNLPK